MIESTDNISKFEVPPVTSPQAKPNFLEKNGTTFYIILKILLSMRKRLGTEAMLEYMALYILGVEKHNPELQRAVEDVLQHISVEKLYREAVKKF